jgi:hypothetical protein
MKDARTPETYFTSQKENEESLDRLKEKLKDLSGIMQAIKKGRSTPTTKKIVEDELERLEKAKYKAECKENALLFIEEVSSKTYDPDVAAELLKQCLDYKAHKRAEPYLEKSGKMVELQIFRADK